MLFVYSGINVVFEVETHKISIKQIQKRNCEIQLHSKQNENVKRYYDILKKTIYTYLLNVCRYFFRNLLQKENHYHLTFKKR